MVTTTTPDNSQRHRLRRLPLPASQPPYDDEVGIVLPPQDQRRRGLVEARTAAQGALALSITASNAVPSAPQLPARLRLVGDGVPVEGSRAGRLAGNGLPDPRRWTAQLTQAAIECIYGQRPVQQLLRWTNEAAYNDVVRRNIRQDVTPIGPSRVRSVRVCRVNDAVAEASAVVQLGPRAQAVALRLEAVDGRWLCTAFDLIETTPMSDQPRPVRTRGHNRLGRRRSGGMRP